MESLFSYDDEIKAAETLRNQADLLESGLPEWAPYLRQIAAACELKAKFILEWESQPIALEMTQFYAERAERRAGRKRKAA